MLMITKRIGSACIAATLALGAFGAATAQELSPSHIQAAEATSAVAPTVGNFDQLLPYMSDQIQNRLIRRRPDLFREIATVVEEQAKALAERRENLDNQLARIWAKRFTEEELNEITAFFGGETGAKYKRVAPKIGEALVRSGQNWAKRLSEELYERSVEALTAQGHEL